MQADLANDPPRRKRALGRNVELARAAIRLAAPINARIGVWQARLARLIGTGQRLRTRADRSHVAELTSLESAVKAESEQFLAALAQLPGDMRRQSHLEDTTRALASLSAQLTRAQALLSTPTGASILH